MGRLVGANRKLVKPFRRQDMTEDRSINKALSLIYEGELNHAARIL